MIFPQTLISFVPMFHESANKVTIYSYAKHSQDMGSGDTNTAKNIIQRVTSTTHQSWAEIG